MDKVVICVTAEDIIISVTLTLVPLVLVSVAAFMIGYVQGYDPWREKVLRWWKRVWPLKS